MIGFVWLLVIFSCLIGPVASAVQVQSPELLLTCTVILSICILVLAISLAASKNSLDRVNGWVVIAIWIATLVIGALSVLPALR